MSDLREKVARALFRANFSDRHDPDEIFEGRPMWENEIDGADAAIAALWPLAMERAALASMRVLPTTLGAQSAAAIRNEGVPTT
jgi:hypothetical protein